MIDPKNLRPGEEQYEEFTHKGKTYVQYDFRDLYGNLFSTIASSVEKCLEKRNAWTIKKHLEFEREIRARQGRGSSASV